METKLMNFTCNDEETIIYCILDEDISEDYVNHVIEFNEAYFDLIKERLIGVKVLKFEHVNDIIIVRTFSTEGHEAATYYIKEENTLFLYNGNANKEVFFRKKGLHVEQYEENHEGVMIYRMLDDADLDPVGDGFTLEEAIVFVENNVYNYAEIA
jgi:hypothetical protein